MNDKWGSILKNTGISFQFSVSVSDQSVLLSIDKYLQSLEWDVFDFEETLLTIFQNALIYPSCLWAIDVLSHYKYKSVHLFESIRIQTFGLFVKQMKIYFKLWRKICNSTHSNLHPYSSKNVVSTKENTNASHLCLFDEKIVLTIIEFLEEFKPVNQLWCKMYLFQWKKGLILSPHLTISQIWRQIMYLSLQEGKTYFYDAIQLLYQLYSTHFASRYGWIRKTSFLKKKDLIISEWIHLPLSKPTLVKKWNHTDVNPNFVFEKILICEGMNGDKICHYPIQILEMNGETTLDSLFEFQWTHVKHLIVNKTENIKHWLGIKSERHISKWVESLIHSFPQLKSIQVLSVSDYELMNQIKSRLGSIVLSILFHPLPQSHLKSLEVSSNYPFIRKLINPFPCSKK